MNNTHATVLEINLANLTHNFNYLKSKTRSNVKMLSVVKASGYGSDVITVAKHLEKIGTDYFAVAYANEGIILREAGITSPILVLHPQPINFARLIDYNLEPNIYSLRVLKEFIKVTSELNKKQYPIHLKLNTGLNRLGFNISDIENLIVLIKQTNTIKVTSLFSHLAASEDINEKDFTLAQIASFKNLSTQISNAIGYTPILHQCNTSGILNYPEAHFSMIRTGIGLYGYGNDPLHDQYLKPIAKLTSCISQIHTLNTGESLGYNRGFIATSTTITATIPIGHADGISRIYGNKKGYVTINNQKAPILGNVCMDMIMVDVTSISCKEGDPVLIFDTKATAAAIAESAGTISYELLTSISPRVSRCIIE